MVNKLTVLIPTYNREERLLNQLKRLVKQEKFNLIDVIIVDNHSDYPICDSIANALGVDIASKIKIIINKVNIGIEANISSLFFHTNSKWVWFLGDDDKIADNSIDIILNDIGSGITPIMFKYSINGYNPHENVKLSSLHELIEYFKSGYHTTGDLIFLSNCVYNMELAKPYIWHALNRSYTCIGHLIPALFSLADNKNYIYCSSKSIISYQLPQTGSEWNFLKTLIEISTISHCDFKLSSNDYKALNYIIGRNFSQGRFVEAILKTRNRIRTKTIYTEVYNSMYKYSPSVKDKIIMLIFWLSYILRINILEKWHSYRNKK